MTTTQFIEVIGAILLAVGMIVWSQTVNKSLGPFVNL